MTASAAAALSSPAAEAAAAACIAAIAALPVTESESVLTGRPGRRAALRPALRGSHRDGHRRPGPAPAGRAGLARHYHHRVTES